MRSTSELDNLIKYINMGKKKRMQGITDEEKAVIREKMYPERTDSQPYYDIDGYKKSLKTVNYQLNVKCKTDKQKMFYKNLLDLDKKVNICDAPAGVGKTFLALTAGLYHLQKGNVSRIIVIVPTVEASEVTKIGLLPGTIDEKIAPYKVSITSNLEKILKISGNSNFHEYATHLINSGVIQFELLSYARGRTYDDCFLILDEAENLTQKECLLLLTRLGDGNSKVAIIGDHNQCDRKDMRDLNQSGLIYASNSLKDLEEVSIDKFDTSDIIRNPFLTKILEAWNQKTEE